jgi:predicted nucleic acid-binding protein
VTSYADASFVTSLYVPDYNSPAALRKITSAQFPVLFADFGELEFINAVSLCIFRKELHPSKADAARRAFRDDVENLSILKLPEAALQHAIRIATQRTPLLGTRSIDVLHVAAAITVKAETFFTFNRKQSKLADAEGLHVV